jgi:hypothetical protein
LLRGVVGENHLVGGILSGIRSQHGLGGGPQRVVVALGGLGEEVAVEGATEARGLQILRLLLGSIGLGVDCGRHHELVAHQLSLKDLLYLLPLWWPLTHLLLLDDVHQVPRRWRLESLAAIDIKTNVLLLLLLRREYLFSGGIPIKHNLVPLSFISPVNVTFLDRH